MTDLDDMAWNLTKRILDGGDAGELHDDVVAVLQDARSKASGVRSLSLEELWIEIRSRTDSGVMAISTKLPDHKEETIVLYHGGMSAIGLSHILMDRLVGEWHSTTGREFGG